MNDARDTCLKLRNRVLLTFLLISVPVGATIDAYIDYEVEGNGFHRTVHYQVDFGNFFEKNCYVALRLSPDPTLYANVDELADLWRHGETAACAKGDTDVERFAEDAEHQNITICSPLKTSRNVLSLPLHQRYKRARENEEFVTITLPDPTLLLGCKKRIKEYPVSKIDLCSRCEDLSIKWREVPYKMKPNDFVWKVAIGDSTVQTIVDYSTICCAWVSTLLTLVLLWDYKRNENKED